EFQSVRAFDVHLRLPRVSVLTHGHHPSCHPGAHMSRDGAPPVQSRTWGWCAGCSGGLGQAQWTIRTTRGQPLSSGPSLLLGSTPPVEGC
ncbi:unnamed protein product, partial [Discosporangium mesarthrocarpum]